MSVFFLFLLATSIGCLTTLYWIPEENLGRGYFQMNALVLLGLLTLAVAVAVLHPFQPFGNRVTVGYLTLTGAFLGGLLYYGAVWRRRWHFGRWAVSATLMAALAALLLSGPHLVTEVTPFPHRQALLATNLVASSLLLGWSLITMLLGHWYLVAPKLSFRHLVGFSWVLVATVGLRIGAVAASLLVASRLNELLEPHPFALLTSISGQGLFFWLRLLWGLAIPAVLSVMALHCARRRSNQSATGILYVLVVGTVIGEITAYYLTVTTGVPV